MNNWKRVVFERAEGWIKRVHTPLLLKEIAWHAIRFAVLCGKSNPFSFALRPLATHTKLRTILGINIAILVLGSAFVSPLPSFAEDTGGSYAIAVAPEGEIHLVTDQSVQLPVKDFRLTQKYWSFHSGVDMAAPVGTEIYPAMVGKVTTVEKGWYGYGNNVIVTHTNGYETLYAHMSAIMVTEGQPVTMDTVLGLVGSTGRSTGPHLHFEVREAGRTVNPGPILGIK